MSLVYKLHKTHVKGTAKNALVAVVQVFLCHLTSAVSNGITCPCNRVYINTRVLKHVYDKRPAEEFDFLVEHVHQIIKYPNQVYKNKTGKKGEFVFIKKINNTKYLCSIEVIEQDGNFAMCEIVTFFRVEDKYLKNYELLWEWKGGNPSS